MDRDSIARRLDWPLLGAALALSLLGATVVYSATRARTDLTGDDPYFFLMRHLLNVGIGCGLAALVVWLGHSRLRDLVPVLYAGTLVLCLVVLSPLGTNVNGSQSWIQLGGGFAFQPSELVKVSVILAMATLLAAGVEGDDSSVPDSASVLRALGLVAIPSVLILATPDVGTTLVLAAIALGVLMTSGAARGWIIGLVTAGVLLAVAVWLLGVLDQYQINRFAAFANPALDPAGVGYNTNQARIAIGSGGLFGQGLFHGSQTLGQFVPEQHTDFIFTVVGEELGFVGGATVIALFGVIMWRGCVIAMKSPDVYGTIVAGGIVTWVAFQSFENMGMALGIMPVTGVPLPFLSYGGSSTFAIWIAIGLLLAIQVRRKTTRN
ncbi:rod shape-determining protein RodA [Streptomyces carpaticus]|uniref:peptidoglycan glycosyltransferase n=2 Tax=Streptomyces TaxID=1883 RepID=A0A1I6U907_9ACTN|nr:MULTISPECIES: rod shape-determining protein RodA [Streptomyces]MCK1815820.1 rod shape-determining protein RodA [Streptomyces sp. XM4011]QKV72262.1 rod shape-determining protein RodA [Streptomyces harbinensis]UWM52626.1 rod shape-determining protein RodA [Streptomyces carpaticus]SFS97892.1 rod shape determining protein RodA [Streptomyces harbinensis]